MKHNFIVYQNGSKLVLVNVPKCCKLKNKAIDKRMKRIIILMGRTIAMFPFAFYAP
ncbi:MAG: hypothetical protein KAH22_02065 [Thiotrichaceae bacterium]|nr:hypothetical protein [Thiotrichaceae bacterium]